MGRDRFLGVPHSKSLADFLGPATALVVAAVGVPLFGLQAGVFGALVGYFLGKTVWSLLSTVPPSDPV